MCDHPNAWQLVDVNRTSKQSTIKLLGQRPLHVALSRGVHRRKAVGLTAGKKDPHLGKCAQSAASVPPLPLHLSTPHTNRQCRHLPGGMPLHSLWRPGPGPGHLASSVFRVCPASLDEGSQQHDGPGQGAAVQGPVQGWQSGAAARGEMGRHLYPPGDAQS